MYNENSLQRKDIVYPELSYLIVGCLYETYNELGGGYQEKHYQKALEKILPITRLVLSPRRLI